MEENAQEFSWNEGLEAIVKNIQEKVSAKKDLPEKERGVMIVAVAGGTCSGKTYLAKELAKRLPVSVVVVSLDDYFKDYRDCTLPYDRNMPNFDCPEAYRHTELVDAVESLIKLEMVHTPEYDILTNTFISPYGNKLSPSEVIIIEGLFAIQFLTAFKNQLRVYLDIDYPLALARRFRRDRQRFEVGYDKVKRLFENQVWPNHEKFVTRQKDFADIIIKQNQSS